MSAVFEIGYHDIGVGIPVSFRFVVVRSVPFSSSLRPRKDQCTMWDLFAYSLTFREFEKTFIGIFFVLSTESRGEFAQYCVLGKYSTRIQMVLRQFQKILQIPWCPANIQDVLSTYPRPMIGCFYKDAILQKPNPIDQEREYHPCAIQHPAE